MKKLLSIFTLLLLVCSGAWADNTVTNPATKTKNVILVADGVATSQKFLDVANTTPNVDDTYLTYDCTGNTGNHKSILTASGNTWYSGGTNNTGSVSSSTFNSSTMSGFISWTGTISLSCLQVRNTSRQRIFYVTGVTGVAVLGADQGDSQKLTIAIEELTTDANPSKVGTDAVGATTNTAVHVLPHASTLDGQKFYKISVQGSGNSNNSFFGQIRFTQYQAPAAPHTVTFTAGSNGTCGTSSLTEASTGAGVELPSVTANTGYNFNGWYTAATEGTKAGDAGNTYYPAADVELFAQYSAKTYAITLSDNNGGVHNGSATATYNSNTLTGITAPEKEGNSVVGYYKEVEYTTLVADAEGNLQANIDGYTGAGGIWTADEAKTLYAKWEAATCATPTITVGAFNFENKGYAVTITNNEDGADLKVSTDGETYTTQTSPYVTYATTTTHYYAKSVKTNYNDSEVADQNVTNTYDGEKKYIAWVYTKGYGSAGYTFAADPMVITLQSIYNVVEVDGGTSAPKADWKNADLIICTEAMQGNNDLSNGMVGLLDGTAPMIGLKLYNYGNGGNSPDATKRWGWGVPANPAETVYDFTPKSNLYKLLNGITYESDGTIKLSTGRYNSGSQKNVVQTVNFSATGATAPADNVIMGNIDDDDTQAVMHYSATKKYFGLGLSSDCHSYYTANATIIVKNAAAMLIAGEDLTTEVATVSGTITEAGWNTFSSNYALDLSTITGGAAYVASTKDNTTITLTETSAKVAAGEGLMIKGTAGETFSISTTTDAATLTRPNFLVGLPNGGTVAKNADNYVYAWTSEENSAGFYFVNDFEPTLGAGKAYLHAEGMTPAKLNIIIDDTPSQEETDGIKSVQGSEFMVNGEAYNLSGQRVGNDYKGIVIVNGKKYLRK